MQITAIDVYHVRYGLKDKKYAWSGGHSVTSFLSNVIKVSTDGGIPGYGEVCPLGSGYMDAYAAGVAEGVRELGPTLNGRDPEDAGACDTNLWYILGRYMDFKYTHDDKVLRDNWKSIEKALLWLQYQDMNECGLLEIPEAGNWMDLLDVRYNTLYDNALYYAASLAYEEISRQFSSEEFIQEKCISAECIHERINLLMLIDRCWVASHFAEHLEKLKTIRLEWFMLYHNIGTISSRPYYLPWVAFRDYGDWCDGLANLLAILTGIADGNRSHHILRYKDQVGMANPYWCSGGRKNHHSGA